MTALDQCRACGAALPAAATMQGASGARVCDRTCADATLDAERERLRERRAAGQLEAEARIRAYAAREAARMAVQCDECDCADPCAPPMQWRECDCACHLPECRTCGQRARSCPICNDNYRGKP